jgi:hypothetical protein
MAKRKDVFLSMEETDEEIQVQQQEESEVINERPREEGEWVVFKLVKSNKKGGGKWIDGVDDHYVNEKGAKARLRLLKGVPQILVSEQKDLEKDYVKQNRDGLHFPARESIIRINTTDAARLAYARKCSLNVDNPYYRQSDMNFYEYNPKKAAERALEKELAEWEVMDLAQKQPESAMRKHAHFLGVAATDEYGFAKPLDRIKAEYMVAAKRDPEKFKKTIGSVDVEAAFLVRKAIGDALIQINTRDISWANGGEICKLQDRESPVEVLVALALQKSKDGKEFLAQLQSVVK